jgi:hypothetical protein
METRRITVLSAGLGVPSSSRLLADQLAAAAQRQLKAGGFDVAVDIVELRDLAVDIANNFVTGYAAPRLAEVIAGVEASDGIIAVTPVFSASYSGLFKSFFDVLAPSRWTARQSCWAPPAARTGTRWSWTTHCGRFSATFVPAWLQPASLRDPRIGAPRKRAVDHLRTASSVPPANSRGCLRGRSRAGSPLRWNPCLSSSCWRVSQGPASPPSSHPAAR